MVISFYQFGQMIIDGKRYSQDILIYPGGRIKEGWRRLEGHELAIEDIADILEVRADVFIMGTGYYGALKVLPKTKEFFEKNGIRLHELKTKKAVELFNRIFNNKNKRVMAGFHLTC